MTEIDEVQAALAARPAQTFTFPCGCQARSAGDGSPEPSFRECPDMVDLRVRLQAAEAGERKARSARGRNFYAFRLKSLRQRIANHYVARHDLTSSPEPAGETDWLAKTRADFEAGKIDCGGEWVMLYDGLTGDE